MDSVDLEIEESTTEWYSSVADEFDSLAGEVLSVRRLDAYLDDARVFCKSWDRTIPRDLM